jgi:hypothetical protein
MATTSASKKRMTSSGTTRSAAKRPAKRASAASGTAKSTSAKSQRASARSSSGRSTSARRASSGSAATASRRSSRSPAAASNNHAAESVRDRLVKGAVGALVGGAAVGGLQRLAGHYGRRQRVMGIPVPNELSPRHLEKLARNIDLKDVFRQIGNAAEQIEARSDDLRALSGQAKRLSRKLS